MHIEVNNLRFEVWKEGMPVWFRISEWDSTESRERVISFRHDDAEAIVDALKNLLAYVKRERKDLF